MKTVYLSHPHQLTEERCEPTVLALGNFDGVHIGHEHVIETAKKMAAEMTIKSAVMTFYPHPSVVLAKKNGMEYITPLSAKEEMISDLGIDYLYIVKFDEEFAQLLPQQFIDEYIIALNVKHVVAGFDYTYGRLGKGTMETMPFHSRQTFSQSTVSKISIGNDKVSSTRIRDLLKRGEVALVPLLLGRFYRISGQVVDGDKRGRTIGFPTANLSITEPYLLPKIGVYAVRLKVKNNWYNGVANIGYKPTFNDPSNEQPVIEVHLFNFDQTIYGEQVIVEWHKFVREEKKFQSIKELVTQINQDKSSAENYFSEEYVKE